MVIKLHTCGMVSDEVWRKTESEPYPEEAEFAWKYRKVENRQIES